MKIPRSVLDEFSEVHDTVEVRTDYSGRAMFGAQCVAIVGTSVDAMKFTSFMWSRVSEPGNLSAVNHDSMGLDMVFYWPSIQVDEEA